ncbi:hypothetical protein [Pseudopontixanthobacter vadosimaris]|uniref:hypothetical protein n=1 Tax=Pseudopontixanthobacter vadosimaris TaxID=2726450 RepID=UPI00197C2F77|nr:hypothetical protein [Pseudopontixanthobacter vadosimaris]
MRYSHTIPVSVALIAAAMAVAPALAQSGGSQKGQAAPAEKQPEIVAPHDDKKLICRKLRVTGTRVPHRVCRTRAEWAAVEAAARESADNLKDAGAINTAPTPGG